jgi:diketogulonate reductase-like aldo/keto reductase
MGTMLDIHSTVKLNSGYDMPLLGFGVFQVKEGAECEQAVRDALAAGYRHIDTAAVYGNEASVGKALAECGLPRQDVFVTTKVWISEFGTDKTRKACRKSLELLRLDYVDLYLIHWPVRQGVMEAWQAMQALRDEGLCRSIGISNFTVRRLEEAFFPHTDETPAVNQIELHPFYARKDVRAACAAKGIQVEAYSPLVRGQRMDDPTLKDVAGNCGKSPAQVLIRWALQHGIVAIPKSVRPERIRQNADVYDFEISPADMARLDALDQGTPALSWRPEEGWF